MSYQCVPSLFRIPEVPGFAPPASIWRGKGGDEGFFAFDASSLWGGHVIVRGQNLCFSLEIDGRSLSPVFGDINGYVYWQGNGYVYYTQTYGWVWGEKFPGYEPLESRRWREEEREYEWTGDRFYTFNDPPHQQDEVVKMRPRGMLAESGESKELRAVWPRWVAKAGEFGVYEGKDGESGERVKGLPHFSGGGEHFVRSLNKEKGYFTYGRIHNAGGKWVIGEVGSSSGWHEGSEPKKDGSVNFRFVKPEGSDAVGYDIPVSFRDYVCGEETEAAFLGSAAIWR